MMISFPVSRTIINAHFGAALADRLYVSGVPAGKPVYTLIDTKPRITVTEVVEPFYEDIRPAYGHGISVYYGTHIVKRNFKDNFDGRMPGL
jgi:hypothetical protein